jgi:hypothetical protein
VRFDLLGAIEQGEQKVIGADAFSSAIYNFRPYNALSPFLGISAGILGVIRYSHSDYNFDARLGTGMLAGIEHSFSGTKKLVFKTEYTHGLNVIPPKKLGGRIMPGGRPGGFYVTIGPRFPF